MELRIFVEEATHAPFSQDINLDLLLGIDEQYNDAELHCHRICTETFSFISVKILVVMNYYLCQHFLLEVLLRVEGSGLAKTLKT